MDDDSAKEAKDRLDADLASYPADVGILFSLELFAAFAKRGWLTSELATAFGSGAFPAVVPAYKKTHAAIAIWTVPAEEYRLPPPQGGT